MRTDYSVNSVSFCSSFYDKFFKNLPSKEIKDAAKFNNMGRKLASPHWNRLALGIAAISTQPFYDYFNPKVDRDTAETSAIRTSSKVVVCSSVGFCIRGGSYKLINNYAHASAEEGSTLLTPKAILSETNKELRANKLKLHKNAFSTVLAIGVMLFTNVLLDAPLTMKLSNKLISLRNKHPEKGGEL